MSGEFDFLDELLSDIAFKSYDSKFPVDEAKKYVESFEKPAVKSELEEKLRKDNARLRSRLKAYSKSLNEQGARLTQLLTEKLSMREEQERIQDCKKKLEEANVYIQATEQLNKQLHELAKTYERDKKVLNEKILALQKKVRKLKKEINGTNQQKLQERKRRLKQLKILIELSEILISLGLLPVKYKRPHDSWKIEVSLNEDEVDGDENDVEEKADEEEENGKDAEKSSPKSVAKVQVPSKDSSKSASGGFREETTLVVMSGSESSDEEGPKSSLPPSTNPPPRTPIVDSMKALYKRLINSTDDMIRVGSDFGSTVTSPSSSLSSGDPSGMGSSLGSEGSSNSRLVSPISECKSLGSDIVRTEKSMVGLSEDDDWHWDGSCANSPATNPLEVNHTVKNTSSKHKSSKREEVKISLDVSKKSNSSNDSMSVYDILKEMCFKLPPLLPPFEMDDLTHLSSSKSVTSDEWLSKKLSGELAKDAEVPNMVCENLDQRVDAAPTNSCITDHSSLHNATNKPSVDKTLCKVPDSVTAIPVVSDQESTTVTVDAAEGLSSVHPSPVKSLTEHESRTVSDVTKNVKMNVDGSTSNAELCDDAQQLEERDASRTVEVSCDLSMTTSLLGEGSANETEDAVNCRGGKGKRRRGRSQKVEKKLEGKGKSKEKKHPRKDDDNTADSKSTLNQNPTPSPPNEEFQRRYSLRLRNNTPKMEGTSPAAVNKSAKIPSEGDSKCSLNTYIDGKGLAATKTGHKKPKRAMQIVEYSDTSDTCDSASPTRLDLEENASPEPFEILDAHAKMVAVGVQEPSEGVSEHEECDSGIQMEAKELGSLPDKCNLKTDIPSIMNGKRLSPHPEQLPVKECNISDRERNVPEGIVICDKSRITENVPSFDSLECPGSDGHWTSDAISNYSNNNSRITDNVQSFDSSVCLNGERNVSEGSVTCDKSRITENVPSFDSSECPGGDGHGTSDGISNFNNNNNSNYMEIIENPCEVVENPFHDEEDQGSAESEAGSSVQQASIFNPIEESSQDLPTTSQPSSSFSFSSDESHEEFSDAISVIDECDNDVVMVPKTTESNDVSNKNICMPRKDLGVSVSSIPVLNENISPVKSSENKSKSAILVADSLSSPSIEQEETAPIKKFSSSQELSGNELQEDSLRSKICDKRVSLENINTCTIVKDPINSPQSEGYSHSDSSRKGSKETLSVAQEKAELCTEISSEVPLTTSVSNKLLTHSLHNTRGSPPVFDTAKEKSKESSRLSQGGGGKSVQVEPSTSSIGEESVEKNVGNASTSLHRGVKRGRIGINESQLPIKKLSAGQHSVPICGPEKSLTSTRENGQNFVGSGTLKKIISFFSRNTQCRITVPFFFGKLEPLQFPGVKFQICGQLASEFYPDVYSVPALPSLSFGHGDFEKHHQSLSQKNAGLIPKLLQHPGIKFYKKGSFAPPNFNDLYLNPKRLSLSFAHRRWTRVKSYETEGDSALKGVGSSEIAVAIDSPDYAPMDKDGDDDSNSYSSDTLCNDEGSYSESESEISSGADVPVSQHDSKNNFVGVAHDSSIASAYEFETVSGNLQPLQKRKSSPDAPDKTCLSEGEHHSDEQASSHDKAFERSHEENLVENSTLPTYQGTQILSGNGVPLAPIVVDPGKVSSVGTAIITRDSISQGSNVCGAGPNQTAEGLPQKEKSQCCGTNSSRDSQPVEKCDISENDDMVPHDSCDSVYVEYNSRASCSSEGYLSDKEDSPNGSIVEFVVHEKKSNDFVERKLVKVLSRANFKPRDSIEVDTKTASSCQNSSEEVSDRDVGLQDEREEKSVASPSVPFNSTNYTWEDSEKAHESTQGNCMSKVEEVTSRDVGRRDEKNHVESDEPSEQQGVSYSDESSVYLKEGAGNVSGSTVVVIAESAVEGSSQKEICVLPADSKSTESVVISEGNRVKSMDYQVEERSADKVDHGGVVGEVRIDDLMMAICPSGQIPGMTLKDVASDEGEILGSEGNNLLHIHLPLDIAPFEAKLDGGKQSFDDLFAHENESKTKEIDKGRMPEAELGSGAGIFHSSFSDELAYHTMPKPLISGPGSVDSAVVTTDQMPELALKEKAAEAIHIDKCLMAENIDDLIEIAGGLHSFDDGCLAAEVSEPLPQANILTKLSKTIDSNLCCSNGTNQVDKASDEDLSHDPELLENISSNAEAPFQIKGVGANTKDSDETNAELGKDESSIEKDRDACSSPKEFESQERSALIESVSHSACDSRSSLTGKKNFHSSAIASVQSCIENKIEKGTDDLLKSASIVKDCNDEMLVEDLFIGRESNNLKVDVKTRSGSSAVDVVGLSSGSLVMDEVIAKKYLPAEVNIDGSSLLKNSMCEVEDNEQIQFSTGKINPVNKAQIETGIGDSESSPHGEVNLKGDVIVPAPSSKLAFEKHPKIEEEIESFKIPSRKEDSEGDVDISNHSEEVADEENDQRYEDESSKVEETVYHIQTPNPSLEENEIVHKHAVSPGKWQNSKRNQIAIQQNSKGALRCSSHKDLNIPKSPGCILESDMASLESLSPKGLVVPCKENIVTMAAEKDLFGTDLSDSSSDSIPLAKLVKKKLKKRKINVIHSSESEDEHDKRRKINESKEHPSPTERQKAKVRRRKSLRSKCSIIFGSPLAAIDSAESPIKDNGSPCPSPTRDVDHHRSHTPDNVKAVDENADEKGETAAEVHEFRNDSTEGAMGFGIEPLLAGTTVSTGVQSEDKDELMASTNIIGKKSHLPILTVPSRPGESLGNSLCRAYMNKKPQTLKPRPPVQEKPPSFPEERLTLPMNSCNAKLVKVDDGLNAGVISSPEEELPFFNVEKEEELPQVIGSVSQSSGRKHCRKQSFAGSLKCDDVVIIEETVGGAPKPKKKKPSRSRKKLVLTGGPEGEVVDASSCKDGEHAEPSKKCVFDSPQKSHSEIGGDISPSNGKNPSSADIASEEDNKMNTSISDDSNKTILLAAGNDSSNAKDTPSGLYSGKIHVKEKGRSSEEDDPSPLKGRDSMKNLASVIPKGKIRKCAKNKGLSSSSIKGEVIHVVGKHDQPQEKCSGNLLKSPPAAEEEGSPSSRRKTRSSMRSKMKHDEEKSESGEEQDIKPSRKGNTCVTRASPRGKQMTVIEANSTVTGSKEDVEEGEKHFSEPSRDVKRNKRIAHVPKSSLTQVEVIPSSVTEPLSNGNSVECDEDDVLPHKKKESLSKVSETVSELDESGIDNYRLGVPSKENEDINSNEQQIRLPLKKRITIFPVVSTTVTKANMASSSKAINAGGKAALKVEEESKPHFSKRIAHVPKLSPKVATSNAYSSVSRSLSERSMKGNESETIATEQEDNGPPSKKRVAHVPKPIPSSSPDKNSLVDALRIAEKKESSVQKEPYYNHPAKKRIAHTPKPHLETSNEDCFNSNLSETESHSNLSEGRPQSTRSPKAKRMKVGRASACPKTKMSRLSKLRKIVSRVKGFHVDTTSEATCSKTLVHHGGACCSKKVLPPGGNKDDSRKIPETDSKTECTSTRRKKEVCGKSPKRKRTNSKSVGELPRPESLEDKIMSEEDEGIGSLSAINDGVATSKSPQKKAPKGDEPKAEKNLWETPLGLPSQKCEASSNVVEKPPLSPLEMLEKTLEDMEVPPLSPLSGDDFVDSLIEFPDSSGSEGDVDQASELNVMQELTPKGDKENVKCEGSSADAIRNKLEGGNNEAEKNCMKRSAGLVGETGDEEGVTECLKEMPEKDTSSSRGLDVSIGTPLTTGEALLGPVVGGDSVISSQDFAGSAVIQDYPGDSGSGTTPTQLRLELESPSTNWKNNLDYFSKMLTKVREENEANRNRKALPYVSRDKRRIIKAQLKKLNGQNLNNNLLNEMVAVLDDPSKGYQSKHIAKYLVRMLSKEDEDDVQTAVLPGAPRLTPLQMRALTTILVIENRSHRFKDLSEVVLRGIQFILFRLAHCPPIGEVKSLARMYTAICMAKRDILRVRCFIYDALFAIGTKAGELITVVLSMWHEVLPQQQPSRVPSHIETSVFLAISHVKLHKNATSELVKELESLKLILRNMYHSEHFKKDFDQYLDEVSQIMAGGEEIKDLEPAVVLMAKRQGWEWTHKNLLCSKLVSIMDSWKENVPSQTAAVTAIKLIGLLSRSCPIETCGPVKNIIETLTHTLLRKRCDDPRIKEALVVSLIRLARYHNYHIVRALDIWRPMRDPPPDVVKAIKSFILRDNMQKFWKTKFGNWKTRKANQHERGGYFEPSEAHNECEVPCGENGGKDGVGHVERIAEQETVGGGGKRGRRQPPKRNRLQYKEWIKEKKNQEWVDGEVKKLDGMAFPKSNKKMKKKKK